MKNNDKITKITISGLRLKLLGQIKYILIILSKDNRNDGGKCS